MMNIKKLLAIACCIVLIVVMITACGSGAQTTGTSTGTAAVQSSAVAQTESTKAEEPAKLKFLVINWMDQSVNSPGNDRIKAIIDQKLNIDLQLGEMVKPDDAVQKLNLIIASGEKYDIMNIPGDFTLYRNLIDQKFLQPIDDLLNSDGKDLLANANPDSWRFLKGADGKIYAVPWESPTCTTNVVIRKDLIDKYSLPLETVEDFEKAMLTFKQKDNLSGLELYDPALLDEIFTGSFIKTGYNEYLDTDGKIKPYFVNPGFKDYLAAMQRFYKEGIIEKDFLTMKYETYTNIVNGGKAGAFTVWGYSGTAGFIDSYKKSVPTADFMGVKPLKGTVDGSFKKQPATSDLFVITKDCANPAAAMKYMNYVAGTQEGYLLARYGEENKDYFIASKDENQIILDPSKPSIYQGQDQYAFVDRCGVLGKFVSTIGLKINMDYAKLLSTYPLTEAPQYGLVFDITKMKSKDNQTSLDDFIKQEKFKVIMGQSSPDNWDKVIEQWMQKGGSTFIDDMTEQYNAWKK